ncbi:hypothetical protein GcC1_107015 [Golovinomyces cichoracearum]|uniref:Uncharacterized protein n=1 Tax=Golovinomyces cichoracearum TaxID=62708 RepID=A0A420I977_9PEZI|nr:hypothetical protein GcC1_107015 [Golovinomyces cichoracearum]
MEQINSFACKLQDILKDPVYSSGVEPESIVSMIEDVALVCNGKKKHVRIPKPLRGIAPMVSIRFPSAVGRNGHTTSVPPLKYQKGRRSRRSEARKMSEHPCSNEKTHVGDTSYENKKQGVKKECDGIVREIERAMKQFDIRNSL